MFHLKSPPLATLGDAVLKARGIAQDRAQIRAVINELIATVCAIDFELGGKSSEAFKSELTHLFESGVLLAGTPLLQSIVRGQGSAVACTVIPVPPNSCLEPGSAILSRSELLLRNGTGIGFDLSALDRPCEALARINAHLVEVDGELIKANRRPAAAIATLRCDHPEVLSFIRSKSNANFLHWRLNISLFITDSLLAAARADEPWALHDLDGILVDTVPAAKIIEQVAASAHYCGEPGILFRDRIDRDNPTPSYPFISTAPCAELAMAEGDGCHFSYINVGALASGGVLDVDALASAASCLTRMLDAVTELTVRGSGGQFGLVARHRRIGVGVTGFADLLIRLKVPYDSVAAVELARIVSETVDFHSKRASVALARERGAFPGFKESRYKDPAWLRRKLGNQEFQIPEPQWRRLVQDIINYGIRHASTTSMPPSGTSSKIADVSKSLEPYFTYRDSDGRPHSIFDEIDYTAQPPPPYVQLAREIAPRAHIAIQAAFQTFLDDGVSKTINLDNGVTVSQIVEIIYRAHDHGLKGLCLFRDGCLDERMYSDAP